MIKLCPQWRSTWTVEGSEDNTYMVQFHMAEKPTCTCPAYRYSGLHGEQMCKHIRRVMQHGCFYSSTDRKHFGHNDWEERETPDHPPTHGLRLMSTNGVDAEERCPTCGANMILKKPA